MDLITTSNPNLCINLAIISTQISNCNEVLYGLEYNFYYGSDYKIHYVLRQPTLDSVKSSNICLSSVTPRFRCQEPFLANIPDFVRLILGIPLVPLGESENILGVQHCNLSTPFFYQR